MYLQFAKNGWKGHADLLEEHDKLKPQHKKKRKRVANCDTIESTSKMMKQTNLLTTSPFVIGTMSPISIVRNHSFKTLNNSAQQLPNPSVIMFRRACNRNIVEKYLKYKENIKVPLKSVDFDFVCTSADIWSSSNRKL